MLPFFTLKSICRFYFLYMSKRGAKSLMTNSNLIDKKGFFYNFFCYIYKMNNTTYYQRNREIILNRAKDYYENDKERLREQARDKYRNVSEEDKKKKREYGKNRYHNMPEEKREKFKKYQKNLEKQESLSKIINKIVYVLFFSKIILHYQYQIRSHHQNCYLIHYFINHHQYNSQFLSFLVHIYIFLKVFENNIFCICFNN